MQIKTNQYINNIGVLMLTLAGSFILASCEQVNRKGTILNPASQSETLSEDDESPAKKDSSVVSIMEYKTSDFFEALSSNNRGDELDFKVSDDQVVTLVFGRRSVPITGTISVNGTLKRPDIGDWAISMEGSRVFGSLHLRSENNSFRIVGNRDDATITVSQVDPTKSDVLPGERVSN